MEEQLHILEMRNIRKQFPGVLANDDINLAVRSGEIHALLGENGAGKSTSMNILTGLYREDSGEIWVRGKKVTINSPKRAIELGIAMVHQHFRLVQTFSVAENVTLGLAKPRLLLDIAKVEAEVAEFSQGFGLQVDPRAKIWQLSVGEQQRVEIVKMLYRGVDILIMDEPTAVLTPQEVQELFGVLRKMTKAGKAVIFITHKLDEVMEIADRVTVFRKGKDVATMERASTNQRELAMLMVGREMVASSRRGSKDPSNATVLSLSNVSAVSDRSQVALENVGFQVTAGSVFGIAGVAGNGQKELAQVIAGLRKVSTGSICVDNRDITNKDPLEIIKAGVSFVPEERMGMGLVPNLSVAENAVLKSYREKPISSRVLLNRRAVLLQAKRFVDGFDIKTASLNTPVRLLSGGNAQRLLLARETDCQPKLIIACHPTRGLDIAATEAVRQILLQQREEGVAVLLISEDLDELMALCDEIAVMYEGKVMGIVPAGEFDRTRIGLLMTGIGGERSVAM